LRKSPCTTSLKRYFSSHSGDWEKEIAKEYQKFNDAIGDVRGQFIVHHRIVDKGVRETEYSGGKRVIVNYNTTPYEFEGKQIAAKDYLAT
jgi:hypothetical protein